jgi:membrane-associated protease RseP (regulator of RpoE activity)
MMRRCALLLALAQALAACAPGAPQAPAGSGGTTTYSPPAAQGNPVAQQARLFRVSYPLLRAARDLCADATVNGVGLFALNRHGLGHHAPTAWQFGIDDRVQVLAAAPESPAARAGIAPGDFIVALNGEPGPRTAQETRLFGLRLAQLAAKGGPVEFTFQRGDTPVNVTLQPETLCGYHVHVVAAPQVNAHTDGKRVIQISTGMMAFTRSDTELALVVAHEIAHNVLGHLGARAEFTRSLNANGATPLPGGLNGLTPAFAQALEMEADHLGLYIMARAGLRIADAPAFVARLGAATVNGPQAETHPASAARAAALRKTVAEIEDKRARGAPLNP